MLCINKRLYWADRTYGCYGRYWADWTYGIRWG